MIPPPPRARALKPPRSPLQQYIHFLIRTKLDATNVNVVIKHLRKLPWNKEEDDIEYHVVKATLSVARKKVVKVAILADCLSGLVRYRPRLVIKVIDLTIEDLLRGLEQPRRRDPQRLISIVRFIGELYNYSLLSTPPLFEVLYLIINLGHENSREEGSGGPSVPLEKYNPKVPSEIDLPGDSFRCQLGNSFIPHPSYTEIQKQKRIKKERKKNRKFLFL